MDEDLAAGCPGPGTAEGIDAIDLFTGHRVWSNVSYAALDCGGRGSLKATVVEDQRTTVCGSISVRDGLVSEAFETPFAVAANGSRSTCAMCCWSATRSWPTTPGAFWSTGHPPELAAGLDVISDERGTAGCFRSRTPRATVACS